MNKPSGMFRTADGVNHLLTFALVCWLYLSSGLCNGMIDVLNEHFQNSLGITKTQSASVQGAWYAAYFLMAFPSGWVARRFGYRSGILTGLLVVLLGSVLFVPVTKLAASQVVVFACFLGALFMVGAGLTFIETVSQPLRDRARSQNCDGQHQQRLSGLPLSFCGRHCRCIGHHFQQGASAGTCPRSWAGSPTNTPWASVL